MGEPLPLLGSALSLTFGLFLVWKYVRVRGAHHLAWCVGLLMFTVTFGLEGWSEIESWEEGTYRAYYILSGVQVGVLGAGSVYLLGRRVWGHAFTAYVVLASMLLAYVVLGASVEHMEFHRGAAIGGSALPSSARLSILLTIPGAAALIAGSIYSWHVTKRLYNLLILAGVASFTAGGALSRAGVTEALLIGNLIGLALLFSGFMLSAGPGKTSNVREEDAASQ